MGKALPKPLLVRDADSKGYTRYLFADPIGQNQAGVRVSAELDDGGEYEIILHGQREFDVPGKAKTLRLAD